MQERTTAILTMKYSLDSPTVVVLFAGEPSLLERVRNSSYAAAFSTTLSAKPICPFSIRSQTHKNECYEAVTNLGNASLFST